GLSILDQAIAQADLDAGEGGALVTAARVRDMLGLADKGAQRRLFQTLLEGDAAGLLGGIDDQYSLGVEPLALMRSLLDIVHRVTLAQVGGAPPDSHSEEERATIADWAARLPAGQLHRLWQLLLKGYEEVRQAPDPLVSAQMALLRVLRAAGADGPGRGRWRHRSARRARLGGAGRAGGAQRRVAARQPPQVAGAGNHAGTWATGLCPRGWLYRGFLGRNPRRAERRHRRTVGGRAGRRPRCADTG
ncbi:MAG: hypothetical protein DI636_00185, partial [Pelagerythrobacter marensis]